MTNIKDKNITNEPFLRFPEFSGKWEEKKLGEIGKFFSGGTPKTTNKEYYDGDIPFIRSGEINSDFTELKISNKALKNSSAKMIDKGDLLIALYGATSGEIAISKIKGAINQAILCINTQFNKEFIKGIWQKHIDKILKSYLQGGQGNLSSEIVKSLKFYFPTLTEQTKIAAFLSKIDERISTQRALIRDLEIYKKGLMQKLFSREIRFPNFSDEWEEKALGEVLEEPQQIPEKNADKIELLSVKLHCKGVENTGNFPKLTEKGRPYYRRYKNEILIGRQNFHNGGIGIVKEENNGKICSNAISSYNVINDDLYYVYYFISRKEYYKKVDDLIGGTGQKELSKNEFSKLKISLPTLEEQQKIAQIFFALDRKIHLENQLLEQYQQQKKYLLQKMFV